MPMAKEAAMQTRPTTASFQPERFHFFWTRPKTTAKTMNMIDTMPAAPFVCAASASCVTPSVTV